MSFKSTFLLAALAVPLASAVAEAAPIIPTVNFSAGTTFNTPALTGFQTFSANMNGSQVTVTFAGGGSDTATWNSGAFGLGWSLTEIGDTFGGTWTFSNLGIDAITGFTFNGVPGNTIFDVVSNPELTPTSGSGIQFSSVDGPNGLAVSALYTNQLTVGGILYGDEYTSLVVSFGGAGLAGANGITFVADTDNASADRGGITQGVPEASTWAMIILGFAGMGFMGYRRSRKDGAALAAA